MKLYGALSGMVIEGLKVEKESGPKVVGRGMGTTLEKTL